MLLLKIELSIAASLFLILGDMHAQNAVVAAGGEAGGADGSVSYSIGQMVYTTNVGTNGNYIAQGVQQPYEISVFTAIENTGDILLGFSAYPNPATDILKLKTGNHDFQNISFRLFDINGKLIKAGKITGPETSVDMQNLTPSIYFIKVIENNKVIKVFKIIKR